MARQIKVTEGFNPANVGESFACVSEPVVLKGLVDDWPVVKAGTQSPNTAADYIREFYSGDPMTAFAGAPEIRGRVAYNDDLTGFNFERINTTLDEVLNPIFENLDNPKSPAYYVGSTLLDRWFPGFRDHNDLNMGDRDLLVSLWLGNRIKVSAHFDVADNIACCVVGRRKFTLFPPEQLDNLYVGPWDNTPAGQPISLVDFDEPDLDKFPKFQQAMDASYTATLEPGDAICIPSMWWHHVEGLDGFNILVNYWWRTTPRYMGAPLSVLKHALLSLKGLPPEQRKAWQHIFDFYVFNESDEASAHIPEHSRGILGQMSDVTARQLRADLLNQLNR